MPFDSPDLNLGALLEDIRLGKVQLPDFQREWKWDDPRIASLLTTITLGYPVGVVMMLETGGPDVNFAPKPLAGVNGTAVHPPEQLLLDGQQRLTSLYQSLKAQRPVDTLDPRGKKLRRWYLIDIQGALGDEGDREEAIISAPEDLKVRDDFGRQVRADYSTIQQQCAAGAFPLWIAFDMPKVFAWQGQYVADDPARVHQWNAFYQRVLNNVISYTVPVIVLKKSTPKEAVCTVFEKVNTGGVPLNVFELLTATFAADKTHRDFRLKDDWRARHARLTAKPVLRSVENTDFLQAVTLLASHDRRADHLNASGDPAQAPGITCKRRDILRLTLTEYLRHAPAVESALLWAAGFLAQQHIFRADDLPYRTRLVPLAAIKAVLGQECDSHAADKKLRRWYWSGVLGELYGGAIETRFARDFEQVVPWIREDGPEPITVAEANFQASRLLTLRTRNSAAYKGVYALLMRKGCMDWVFRQPMNMATFLDLAVDIHHIFPKAWCERNGIDHGRRESIVNKTALSATTNRKIGGRSPAEYVKTVEVTPGIDGDELDAVFQTHLLDPATLRDGDFEAFFADRRARLLNLIGEAIGKPIADTETEPPAAFVQEDDEPSDTEADLIATAESPTLDDSPDRASAEAAPALMGNEHLAHTARTTELPVSGSGQAGPAGPRDDESLEQAFHAAMVEVYQRAKREAGYHATYFIQMVSESGGLATARYLLHASGVSEGFTALWERRRLDLTVEAVVLQERFAPLFSDEERRIARARLREYGYHTG
jgi:hypothetical protein